MYGREWYCSVYCQNLCLVISFKAARLTNIVLGELFLVFELSIFISQMLSVLSAAVAADIKLLHFCILQGLTRMQ